MDRGVQGPEDQGDGAVSGRVRDSVHAALYVYTPPRPLAEIDAELKALEAEIQVLLGEVTE